MKIFLDTANIDDIRRCNETGMIDGVTTNPSLVAKEGRPFEEIVREICEIVDGDISAEVLSTTYDEMLEEARKLAAIHKNVVVKIPLIREGIRAVRTLTDEKIRTNVTLCFSASQAVLAAKAGATYISPFVGRVDDISGDGMDLIEQIVSIYENYGFLTQVLVASIRHPKHFVDSALLGADVVTIPTKIFDTLFKHPLTDRGLEAFLADWEKAKAALASA